MARLLTSCITGRSMHRAHPTVVGGRLTQEVGGLTHHVSRICVRRLGDDESDAARCLADPLADLLCVAQPRVELIADLKLRAEAHVVPRDDVAVPLRRRFELGVDDPHDLIRVARGDVLVPQVVHPAPDCHDWIAQHHKEGRVGHRTAHVVSAAHVRSALVHPVGFLRREELPVLREAFVCGESAALPVHLSREALALNLIVLHPHICEAGIVKAEACQRLRQRIRAALAHPSNDNLREGPVVRRLVPGAEPRPVTWH
eukprot:scaffold56474_cov63-Phaeocystis_antarctica.AAC.3